MVQSNGIRRIGWLGALLFDALVTALTFFRTWRHRKTELLRAFFSEGVSYFCGLTYCTYNTI